MVHARSLGVVGVCQSSCTLSVTISSRSEVLAVASLAIDVAIVLSNSG